MTEGQAKLLFLAGALGAFGLLAGCTAPEQSAIGAAFWGLSAATIAGF